MTSTNVQTFPGEVVINGKLTVSTGLIGDGSAIENIQSSNVTDFASNVSRITNLESGSITLSGQKTFQDEVTFESNIRVQGDLLVANTVNMVVSDPIMELGANNLNTGDLGIIMTRHGVSNSNVAVFYDETADILKMGYTLGGANDTTITLENDPLSVSIQGTLEVDTANVNTMNVSAIEGLQTLSFSSDSTTVPPLQLTAGSLNDGVGALRIDSVEPDIFLNDTDGGFSTVTFANNNVARAAFGRNSGDDFYITVRDPATNGGNWRNTSFVVDSSTGDVSMGYGLTAASVSGDGSGLTALNGDQVTTGTVAAARIDNLDGSKITTGTVAAARIDNLDGSKITTGTVAAARIANLDASKITTGDITRPVNTTGGVTASALTTNDYIYHGSDTDTSMGFPANDTITLNTAGSERVRINSSGNVGVGTNNPLQQLHVRGNGENPVIYMSDPSNNRYSSGIGSHHVGGVGQRLDFYNGDSGANGTSLTSSHIRMSIVANGNVGIGITNPSAKLHVNGYIKNMNPCFCASSDSANVNYNALTPVILENTLMNVGSHYSTSTGIFTAPVTGYYHFNANFFQNTGGSEQFAFFYRSSSSAAWNEFGISNSSFVWHTNSSAGMNSAGNSVTVKLDANNQFAAGFRTNFGGDIYMAHSFFSGFLISPA